MQARPVRSDVMGLQRCIISLATSDKRYPQALVRLQESVTSSGFAGKFMCWPPGSFPEGCPAHLEVPFAFKPYCFREALRHGMELVLWLDAACVVIRKLDPIFQVIAEHGYILFRNRRNMLGEWASDDALRVFDLTRECAMSIPEINAAAIGLNMKNPLALDFLDQWYAAAQDGVAFRGIKESVRTDEDYESVKWNRSMRVSSDPRVRGHRHDQTVAGILVHRLGMQLTTNGIESYSRERRRIGRRTLIVVDRDLRRMDFDPIPLERVRRDRHIGNLRHVLHRLTPRRG
jgi:hypothetical protein